MSVTMPRGNWPTMALLRGKPRMIGALRRSRVAVNFCTGAGGRDERYHAHPVSAPKSARPAPPAARRRVVDRRRSAWTRRKQGEREATWLIVSAPATTSRLRAATRARTESSGHPRLVQTGLDLLAFPTIVFYETGFSIYTLRQASRRSWRIGQREPIRVLYMTYASSAQESCLRLMGKKLMASLPMEGKLHADGLQCMDSDDDLLTAMARELVTRQGVGEAAASVWKSLAVRHGGGGAVAAGVPDIETPVEAEPISNWPQPARPAVQLSLF